MWVPRTVTEIEQAINQRLAETAYLDYKRELPAPAKNADLATDVAAMANDGGVLVYGVEEDKEKRPTKLTPLDGLQSAAERVDQIVQHSVAGPPAIRIHPLQCEGDADRGCLVVEVPPSPGAPHMVLPRKRFYGRGETGNRVLGDAEVERLFVRRARWDVGRDDLLKDALERLSFAGGYEGLMVMVCRPVFADTGLLARRRQQPDGGIAGPRQTLIGLGRDAAQRALNRNGYWGLDLTSITDCTESPRGGFRGSTLLPGEDIQRLRLVLLQIDGDGTTTVLCGAATQYVDGHGLFVVEGRIALLSAQACALSGILLDGGDYAGPVDLALHVDGLQHAVSWKRHTPDRNPPRNRERRPYYERVYRQSARVDVADLVADPLTIAADLVSPLTRVTAGEDWDPMEFIRP